MAKKAFKALPKKAQRAAFAHMDKANEKSGSIQVKKLRDAGKNYNPKTKSVVGLPKLPEATPEQIAKRITNIKKIAPKSSGATALLNSLKKK